MIRRIRAFILGMAEVRSDITTNLDDEGTQDDYERGRYFAARFVRRELVRP